jgi:PAS domain S-box-containing protein
MKPEKKIFLLSIAGGLALWVFDALLDFFYYYRGAGLLDLLILKVPAHEVYIRLVILSLFAGFGLLAGAQIRQLRLAREALRESEQTLSITLHSIGDAVLATDIQGRVTFMNPVAEQLTGWPAHEAKGRPIGEVFHIVNQYSRERVENPVNKVLESGAVVGLANHTVLVSRDGREYIIADSGAPIRTPQGEVRGVVLVFRDDTERHLAREDARQFQHRFRELYEASRDGYAMVDLNGVIIECNRAFELLTGYSYKELKAKHFNDITPAKWHAAEQTIIDEQVMARGYSDIYKKEYLRKDGSVIPIELQTYLYRNPDGEPAGLWALVRDITEKNKAEQTRKQYENLVQSSPMGMFMYNLLEDGRLVLEGANPAADRILGINCAERIGKTIEEAFPPLAETEVPRRYIEAAAHGTPWFFEQVDYDDGTVAGAFEVHAFQTRPGSMAVSFMDITDRKRAEKQLEDNEHRYRNMFERTSSGVVVYEAVGEAEDFIIREFNSAAERIEQIGREALLGRRVTEVFPGVREFGIFDVFQRVWRTGEPEHFPLGFYKDDRMAGWRENYIYKLPSGEVVAVYDDVTARKQAEEALRAERDLLAHITETSPVGIVLVDKTGTVTFANSFAEKHFGLTRAQIEGRAYNDPQWEIEAVEGGPFPEDQLPFALVKSGREPVFDIQHAIALPDGRRLALSINATPLFDDAGQFNGMVASIEDITARKENELALAQYRDRLEALVDERTAELRDTQQKLIAAERLAVLGQFAGNVSHEIRNPLGVISTSAYYLKRRLQDQDEKIHKHIAQIGRQVDNCTRIIKSMLDLTRMEAPRKTAVPLSECLDAATASAGAPPRHIKVALDLPAEPVILHADPEQMRIAFKNLIKNAFQAMEPDANGTLTIAALAATDDSGAPCARITVSDTGHGVPEQMRDKVFQPLFTSRATGIGFGLSITQMIIERHGGAITLENSAGPGASFLIRLPLAREEDSHDK